MFLVDGHRYLLQISTANTGIFFAVPPWLIDLVADVMECFASGEVSDGDKFIDRNDVNARLSDERKALHFMIF